ncbi:hypothetical protein AHAS_Ahas12G0070200 [Arachis hypogaea]
MSLCTDCALDVFYFLEILFTKFIIVGKDHMPPVEVELWQVVNPLVRLGWRHWIGAAVLFLGWIHQQRCHKILGSLRDPRQAEEYAIPHDALVWLTNLTQLTNSVGTTDSALGDDGVLEIDTPIYLETTWRATEDLVLMGLVRSIGISNYDIFLTRDCLAYSKLKPVVNQIETHPYFQRDLLIKFCRSMGFVSQPILLLEVLRLIQNGLDLAEKYKNTAAQISLSWGIQRNTVVIPKSSKLERLKENIQVFYFELSKEDMELIGSMVKKYRTNQPSRF